VSHEPSHGWAFTAGCCCGFVVAAVVVAIVVIAIFG